MPTECPPSVQYPAAALACALYVFPATVTTNGFVQALYLSTVAAAIGVAGVAIYRRYYAE